MEQNREYFDAGVYMVKSRKTGDSYIGASCFVQNRLACHVSAILNKSHKNAKVRRAFRGHGEGDIELRILERCEVYVDRDPSHGSRPIPCWKWVGKTLLLERERHWIRTLKPSLNSTGRAPIVGVHIPIQEPESNSTDEAKVNAIRRPVRETVTA
jgi:hypothetical protein